MLAISTDPLVGDNYKWWRQNPNFGYPHGCLVGKYKPFSFLAWKKNPWTLTRKIWKYNGKSIFYFFKYWPKRSKKKITKQPWGYLKFWFWHHIFIYNYSYPLPLVDSSSYLTLMSPTDPDLTLDPQSTRFLLSRSASLHIEVGTDVSNNLGTVRRDERRCLSTPWHK